MIYVGVPSFLALGFGDGRDPVFWLLLETGWRREVHLGKTQEVG